MRFEFLGTGTSSGVPAIGCTCAVCTSDDPRDKRLRCSALLRFTDPSGAPRCILIDAGPDLRQQALRAGMTCLDAILFTHNHVDHTWGLDEVRRFNALMDAPIDIYADDHTIRFLRHVYRHIFDRGANINDSFVADLIAHKLEPARPIDLFGLRVTPIPLVHGKTNVLGFRFERASDAIEDNGLLPLAYCTDCSGIPPTAWPLLTGLRTLVLDALRHRAHPTHLTLSRAIEIAQNIAADRTWFVHMSHDLQHAQTCADLPEGISLAWDGLSLGDRVQGSPTQHRGEGGTRPGRG